MGRIMKNKREKGFALFAGVSQISLLILSSFAFAFFISEIDFGKAATEDELFAASGTGTGSNQGNLGVNSNSQESNVDSSQFSTETAKPAVLIPAGVGRLTGPKADQITGKALQRYSTSSGTYVPLTTVPTNLGTISSLNAKSIRDLAGGSLEVIDTSGNKYVVTDKASIDAIKKGFMDSGVAPQVSSTEKIKGLFEYAAGAATVYGLGQLLGSSLGWSKQNTNAVSLSLGATVLAYGAIDKLADPNGFIGKNKAWISLGIGIAIFAMMYKKQNEEVISFECTPYQAPLGGARCEECNKDPLKPCSEYRCRALGQACGILNKGTVEERCVWLAQGDVTSPIIEPWKDVLTPSLKYTNVKATGFDLEDSEGKDKCIKPFSLVEFGVETNEASQCKIDYERKESYDDMQYYFGEDSLYSYNHSQRVSFPGLDFEENGTVSLNEKKKEFSLYVRCRDGNGNTNVDEYVVNFCIDDSPDTTPPIIKSSSIPSGSPVSYKTESTPIIIYVNEQADCRWARQDKAYDEMENGMQCSSSTSKLNSEYLYPCTATLNGIRNDATNSFYFRCKDGPGKADKDRNTNVQSYKLDLRGSQTLNIFSVKPNETVYGSADVVTVSLQVETTSGSENNGKSICYFSPNGQESSFIQMFESDKPFHKQNIDLRAGDYRYYIRCIDPAGNVAESNTTFKVFVDKSAPKITRAYRQEEMKIVTDEDAECSYSLTSCNFNFTEGVKLIYSNPDDKKSHFAQWNSRSVYHIKCRDAYGNEPSSAQCSLVVAASDVSTEI